MTDEKLCLKWNDFQDVLKDSVGGLRNDTDFTDVTLACEDQSFKAHKVILSACSPFFKKLLKSHPHPQPLVYMRGIKATELTALLDFIYHGETNIFQEQLEGFLALAEELELKGLRGNSEDIASELPKYTLPKQEPFLGQNQRRSHLSKENNRNGDLTSKAGSQGAVIPIQREMIPIKPNSAHIDPDTLAKVDSMIEKRSDGYSCTQCEYTTRRKHNIKEHVEKHIDGLEYPCNSCDKVLRSSNSLRVHKSRCNNLN